MGFFSFPHPALELEVFSKYHPKQSLQDPTFKPLVSRSRWEVDVLLKATWLPKWGYDVPQAQLQRDAARGGERDRVQWSCRRFQCWVHGLGHLSAITSLDISQGYVKLMLLMVNLIRPRQSLGAPSPCPNWQHHPGVRL